MDDEVVEQPKRKVGRPPGVKMSDAHRDKIRNSKILQVLIAHVEGKQEMSASQVAAGLGLLKKVLPDLQSVELSGDPDNPVRTVTRIELVAPGGNSSD